VPKYVTVEAHLSLDELAHLYRKAVDPVERSHFHIIWLLAQGKRFSEVALVTRYCLNWIRILARRYNQEGAQVLADQRKQNTGAPALLSDEQKNQLRQLLEQASPDGGLWTGPKVAHWMSGQTGRKIHAQRGWDYLKHLGFSTLCHPSEQSDRYPSYHFLPLVACLVLIREICLAQTTLSTNSSVCLTYSSPRHFFEILILVRILRHLNHLSPPCAFDACCLFIIWSVCVT